MAPRLPVLVLAAFLAVLLAVLAPPAAASQADFDRGVEASRAGRYPDAVAAFKAALDDGDLDPAVYHGLGNALYRQDRRGLAIAAWLRGLELRPTDGDLLANLAHARKQTQDRLELPAPSSGPFFWQAAVSPATEVRSAGVLAALGLSLVLFGAVRRHRSGAPPRWVRLDAIGLLSVAGVLALSAALHAARLPPATVLQAQVSVRSALGAEGVELFVLHQGAVVATVERYGGGEASAAAAVLIELPDGRKGWVPSSAVDVADPAAPFPLGTAVLPPSR
ncbi:MAG: tetratricopeptide repeat protein [Oligoflexia bacterium]|nr:tetratricopeptide repeat protein [Oligoflexia bacterium]